MMALVAGALAVTFLAAVWGYWRNARRKEKTLPVPRNLPANVDQRLSGYSFTRSYGGQRVFTVHAARSVAFKQGGTTVLEDVLIELFGRGERRHDTLRTRQSEYNPQTGALTAAGKVEIVLNATNEDHRPRPAVYLETANVSFNPQGSLVVTDQPVEFRAGPASGTARGLRYATKEGWLELESDVAVDFEQPGKMEPAAPVRLTASRLRYVKSTGEVILSGPVEFKQATRRVSAGQGTVFLDARNRITQALLEGNVRGFDGFPGSTIKISALTVRANFDVTNHRLREITAEGEVEGELKRQGRATELRAQRLQVTLAGLPPKPQKGSAAGNVHLTSEPLPGVSPKPAAEKTSGDVSGRKQDLTAVQLFFAFQPGRQSLLEARTAGPGKLLLIPTDGKGGEWDVTSEPLIMSFDPRGRPRTLEGLSRTHMLFQPSTQAPSGALPQETFSDRFEAAFDPETQSLESLEQSGHFQFREGDRQASSEGARYDPASQVLTLVGRPLVSDADTRILADEVRVDFPTGIAAGTGHVQSTQRAASGSASGEDRDLTHVVADRVRVEREGQFAHYEGHVRAWHGQNVIESSALDVYKRERRVASGKLVVTSVLQPAALGAGLNPVSASARQPAPVEIRAEHLDYFDEGRRGIYRGNVELETERITLRADRLDVYFSEAPRGEAAQIERAVADGHVVATEQARRATGEHAEYFAVPGKIVLSGGPPALYDAQGDFTTGRRLTFFIHDDTVLVDGDAESPTYSKHRIPQ